MYLLEITSWNKAMPLRAFLLRQGVPPQISFTRSYSIVQYRKKESRKRKKKD
jgi:hypothetical protein